MQKSAETQYPIHDILKERWSPRAFATQPVEEDKLWSLFEAARWSPSAANLQPWSFIVGTYSNEDARQKLVETLKEGNRTWAKDVPVLVLAIAKTNPEMPALNRYAYYDLGQAVAHLTVQASALGLHVHQMGGFDAEKARSLFAIPEGYEPLTVFAIGYFGNIDDLSGDHRERELAARTRKPLTDLVYGNEWSQPLNLEADHELAAKS